MFVASSTAWADSAPPYRSFKFHCHSDVDVTSTRRNWRFETMDDDLHRADNTGQDANGISTVDWRSMRGKRWSAYYDRYNDANTYRNNGMLVMGGTNSGETDPTRPIDYVDDGVPTPYGSSKLYISWLDTFSRKWVGPGNEHAVDPASPALSVKYGYFEARVGFAQMMRSDSPFFFGLAYASPQRCRRTRFGWEPECRLRNSGSR